MSLIMGSVESSNLKAVGYDASNHLLAVAFKGPQPAMYLYHGVHPDVHMKMITAESVGSYFNQNVKDKYATTKLDYKMLVQDDTAKTPVKTPENV